MGSENAVPVIPCCLLCILQFLSFFLSLPSPTLCLSAADWAFVWQDLVFHCWCLGRWVEGVGCIGVFTENAILCGLWACEGYIHMWGVCTKIQQVLFFGSISNELWTTVISEFVRKRCLVTELSASCICCCSRSSVQAAQSWVLLNFLSGIHATCT